MWAPTKEAEDFIKRMNNEVVENGCSLEKFLLDLSSTVVSCIGSVAVSLEVSSKGKLKDTELVETMVEGFYENILPGAFETLQESMASDGYQEFKSKYVVDLVLDRLSKGGNEK